MCAIHAKRVTIMPKAFGGPEWQNRCNNCNLKLSVDQTGQEMKLDRKRGKKSKFDQKQRDPITRHHGNLPYASSRMGSKYFSCSHEVGAGSGGK